MKRLIVVVVPVLLLALVAIISGEQCQTPCPKCTNQPTPQDCKSGCLTKDRCGCCLVCAKAKNETCGGYSGVFGKCADDLYCEKVGAFVGICKGS